MRWSTRLIWLSICAVCVVVDVGAARDDASGKGGIPARSAGWTEKTFPAPLSLAANPRGRALVWWREGAADTERLRFRVATRTGKWSPTRDALRGRNIFSAEGVVDADGAVTLFASRDVDSDDRDVTLRSYRLRARPERYRPSVRVVSGRGFVDTHGEEARTKSGRRLLAWSSSLVGVLLAPRGNFARRAEYLPGSYGSSAVPAIEGDTSRVFWITGKYDGFNPIMGARLSAGGDWRARPVHRRSGDYAATSGGPLAAASSSEGTFLAWVECRMESPPTDCRVAYRVRRGRGWSDPRVVPGSGGATSDSPVDVAVGRDGSTLLAFGARSPVTGRFVGPYRLMVARGPWDRLRPARVVADDVWGIDLASNTRGDLMLTYLVIQGSDDRRGFAAPGHVQTGLRPGRELGPIPGGIYAPPVSVDERGNAWVANAERVFHYRR